MTRFHLIQRAARLLAAVCLLAGLSLAGPAARAQEPAPAAALPARAFLPVVRAAVVQALPLPPSAQQKIRQALDAGQIDYGTSLLYRAYASFGDDRLPGQFRSSVAVEDLALFHEARNPKTPLSAQVKAQLQPFLVRPDNPASVWSQKARPAGQDRLEAAALPCDYGGWAALVSDKPGTHFKLWASCDGDYEADLRAALAMMEPLWKAETALMGQPVPDLGGASNGHGTEIDIYLLNPLQATDRILPEISSDAYAVAVPDFPFQNNQSSGYILMPRDQVKTPRFRNVLAHELFHILQFAHNENVMFQGSSDVEWWFTEASAKWAGAYFVPENSYEGAHERFSNRYKDDFQHSPFSLHVSGASGQLEHAQMYKAYIWPFFLQQEAGAAAIRDIWVGLKNVGEDWNAALSVIDKTLPFRDNFRRFAVRNLNLDLQPGSPISPRYMALDPRFPDGKPPSTVQPPVLLASGNGAGTHKTSLYLSGLKAEYQYFEVSEAAQQVELILPAAAQQGTVHYDAVVKPRGKDWRLQPLSGQAKTVLCDVEAFYMVTSNYGTSLTQLANPTYEARALETPCQCGEFAAATSFSGKIAFSYAHRAEKTIDGLTGIAVLDQSQDVSFTLTGPDVTEAAVVFEGPVTGTGRLDDSFTLRASDGSITWTTKANGPVYPGEPGGPYSNAWINISLDECTYNFGAGSYIESVTTVTNGGAEEGISQIGGFQSDIYALVPGGKQVLLQGSAYLPAHSEMWQISTGGPAYYPGTYSDMMFYGGYANDDNAGSALVTWQFTLNLP